MQADTEAKKGSAMADKGKKLPIMKSLVGLSPFKPTQPKPKPPTQEPEEASAEETADPPPGATADE